MTLLVVDASAVVDVLAGAPTASSIREVLATVPEVHVPEHFHIEAISALRGLRIRGDLEPERAAHALDLLVQLRVVRHPVLSLAYDIWALRDSLSAYDAAYLALTRQLDARLLSTDAALVGAASAEGRGITIGLP